MAMRDVSNMAHVEHFSNTIIPTLWFEIAMERLPTHLNNRFIFYLNVLPVFVKFVYHVCLIGGPIMLIWSVVRASRQVSNQMQNVRSGNVYMPCEEKVVDEIVIENCESQKMILGRGSIDDGSKVSVDLVFYNFQWWKET